jgi:cysteine--tRNA ligase
LKNTYEQPFTGEVDPADLQSFVNKFIAAMDEDINAANGITVVFELAKWINSGHYDQDVKEALAKMLEVFGVVFIEEVLAADIEALIAERQEARANKDFARADKIRDQLAAQGIKLLDTKEGVRWTRD